MRSDDHPDENTRAARGDRVAVISGAGTGIGRAVALALAERGWALVLLGRRLEPLEATLADAGGEGRGRVFSCDVRDPEAVEEVREAVELAWGAPDLVVPAAGVAAIEALDAMEPERFASVIDTNLTGTFVLLRAFLPAMKERGRGRLVPILSVAAKTAFPGWGAYCASKWGLRGLVAALRQELADTGVLVTELYPGATDTAIWEGMEGDWDRSKMVPPEEVARAVLFALDADEAALVEEVQVGPAGGAL